MFAELSLAKRLEQTEGRAGAAFVDARGGASEWLQIGGVYAMFDGVGSPITQTFGLGLFEDASDQSLEHIEDFFFSRGAAANHEVSPIAGVELFQRLVSRGYAPSELSSVLFLELPPTSPRLLTNPEIMVRLASAVDGPSYALVAAEGWAQDASVTELITAFSRVMFDARGYSGFIAEQADASIATAGLIVHQGVALFAGASTLPPHRGRGAQAALLSARLHYAVSQGCDLAMMVAAPGSASQRNAERLGFRIAYTRTKWSLSQNR